MYPLKRFLVCLDFSPIDKTLIEYIEGLTAGISDAKLYFIHVSKRLDVPDEIKKSYPGIAGPADEILEKEMESAVGKHFSGRSAASVSIAVKEGNVTEQILKWSQVKEIDVIVMGLKTSMKGSGSNPAKITSVCRATVLFVPENTKYQLERVIVPTDFSATSLMALEQALEMKKLAQCRVLLQNVYTVPVGYHYTGKEYAEFAIIMKNNAEKQMNSFIRKNSIPASDVEVLFSIDDDEKPADVIYMEAQAQNVDLIILGSKGRTSAAALLLGSVAVNVLRLNKTVPYMIVKDKKSNMGFIEAFKNI